jgi:hydrogenase maturation protease
VSRGSASRIVAVGIGNTIRTDDGLGVHALERLRRDPRVPSDVTFIDGGTHGLDLLAYVSDSTHLLLLDAIDVGERPGTLIRMTQEELHGLPGAASVHQVGLADLLATLPLVSTTSRKIVLLGVQPSSTDWGASLSSEVETSLAPLIDTAVLQLQLWHESRPEAFEMPMNNAFGESSNRNPRECRAPEDS